MTRLDSSSEKTRIFRNSSSASQYLRTRLNSTRIIVLLPPDRLPRQDARHPEGGWPYHSATLFRQPVVAGLDGHSGRFPGFRVPCAPMETVAGTRVIRRTALFPSAPRRDQLASDAIRRMRPGD